MSSEKQKNAEKIAREVGGILHKLPPPPKFGMQDAWSVDAQFTTCICNKRKLLTQMEIINSGVFHVVSNVCKDCRSGLKHDREMSRIVCCTCKSVVSRLSPGRDLDGFVFAANASYHVDKCGVCTPGLSESPIIEKLIYQRDK
jgi:hypothetical protein